MKTQAFRALMPNILMVLFGGKILHFMYPLVWRSSFIQAVLGQLFKHLLQIVVMSVLLNGELSQVESLVRFVHNYKALCAK